VKTVPVYPILVSITASCPFTGFTRHHIIQRWVPDEFVHTLNIPPQNPIVITVCCYVYDTYDSVAEGTKRKVSALPEDLHIDEESEKKEGKGVVGGVMRYLYFVVDSTGRRSKFTLPSAIHSFLTSFWWSV
jgi:hypothetical protein